jgi:hypothetical protein
MIAHINADKNGRMTKKQPPSSSSRAVPPNKGSVRHNRLVGSSSIRCTKAYPLFSPDANGFHRVLAGDGDSAKPFRLYPLAIQPTMGKRAAAAAVSAACAIPKFSA